MAALHDVHVPGADGQAIRLASLVKVEERSAALLLNHIGQFSAVTVSFNLAEGVSLGEAVELIEQNELDLAMPASIQSNFQCAAAAFRAPLSSTLLLILAVLLPVYVVLGLLYDSDIHP